MKGVLLSLFLVASGIFNEGWAAPTIPAFNSHISNLTTVPNSQLTIQLTGNSYTWSGDGQKNCNEVIYLTALTANGDFSFKKLKTKSCGFMNTVGYAWKLTFKTDAPYSDVRMFESKDFSTGAPANFTLVENSKIRFPITLSDGSSVKTWSDKISMFSHLSVDIHYKNKLVGSIFQSMSSVSDEENYVILAKQITPLIGKLDQEEIQVEVKLQETYGTKAVYFSKTDTIPLKQLEDYLKGIKIIVDPIL